METVKKENSTLSFFTFWELFCHDATFPPHFIWQPPVEFACTCIYSEQQHESNATSHQFTLEISSELKRSWQIVDQWSTMAYCRTIYEPARTVFTSLATELGLIVACNILFTKSATQTIFWLRDESRKKALNPVSHTRTRDLLYNKQ